MWEGRTETLEDYKEMYDIDDCFWLEDFDAKLREVEPATVFTLSADVPVVLPDGATQDGRTLQVRLRPFQRQSPLLQPSRVLPSPVLVNVQTPSLLISHHPTSPGTCLGLVGCSCQGVNLA